MAVVYAVVSRSEVTGLSQPTQCQHVHDPVEDASRAARPRGGRGGPGRARPVRGSGGARGHRGRDGGGVPVVRGVLHRSVKERVPRVRGTCRTGGCRAAGVAQDRWRCRESLCARGSSPSLCRRSRPGRLTTRLRQLVGAGVAEGFSCVLAAARAHGVSWPVAHAAFVEHVTPILEQELPAVAVLGIDETRRGKPVWAQDPVTGRWRVLHDRWHTAIVDAAGSAGLLAHIDGRTASCVTGWLAAQPDSWKKAVTHVAIDLSASYAKAVRDALPDAVLVADKFHLVALGNQMLTEVRQHATRAGPRPPGPEEGPRVGRPPAAAAGSRTPHRRRVRQALERAGRRRRPGRRGAARVRRQGATARPARAGDRARTVRPSRTGSTGSTPRPPPATCPRPTASQRPSRPGGRPCSPRSPPATPTPAPRATTASPSTSDGTRSDSATRSTRDAGYGGPAPATPAGVSHDSPHTARLSSMSQFGAVAASDEQAFDAWPKEPAFDSRMVSEASSLSRLPSRSLAKPSNSRRADAPAVPPSTGRTPAGSPSALGLWVTHRAVFVVRS